MDKNDYFDFVENLQDFIERCQILRSIDRCSNTTHLMPYSVAQHSFYVALYGMVFAHLENHRLYPDGPVYDLELVLQKALIHDLEETITGDILYPLHTEYPEFKEKLDFIRKKSVNDEVFRELPYEIKKLFVKLWNTSKDSSMEGKLVACMDKFEILIFAISEMNLGNSHFSIIYHNALDIILSDFKEIKSVIAVVEKIWNKFKDK